MPGKEVKVVSCLGDWTVIAIGSSRTRLIVGRHGDRAVEDTVRVTGVRLRLCGQTDALPALEEVVCVRQIELEQVPFDQIVCDGNPVWVNLRMTGYW